LFLVLDSLSLFTEVPDFPVDVLLSVVTVFSLLPEDLLSLLLEVCEKEVAAMSSIPKIITRVFMAPNF
jgi:hypothetical protein